MAWRIVVQPNGKYAKFSDVVDNFTDYDMTKDEVFELCRDAAGVDTARYKIEQAEKNPSAFMSLLGRILPTQLTGDGGGPVEVSHDDWLNGLK